MNERLSSELRRQEEEGGGVRDQQNVEQVLLQPSASADMTPNFAGNWKMRSSENFDELLKVLGKSHSCILCKSIFF